MWVRTPPNLLLLMDRFFTAWIHHICTISIRTMKFMKVLQMHMKMLFRIYSQITMTDFGIRIIQMYSSTQLQLFAVHSIWLKSQLINYTTDLKLPICQYNWQSNSFTLHNLQKSKLWYKFISLWCQSQNARNALVYRCSSDVSDWLKLCRCYYDVTLLSSAPCFLLILLIWAEFGCELTATICLFRFAYVTNHLLGVNLLAIS